MVAFIARFEASFIERRHASSPKPHTPNIRERYTKLRSVAFQRPIKVVWYTHCKQPASLQAGLNIWH
jgi:hypothetical protein